jgi:serine/threonine protein phosphatase PrpC
MPFLTAVLSRVGGRDHNEDYCSFAEAGGTGCWVVADGLGGHCGGELASKTAVDATLASFAGNGQVSPAALNAHLEAAQSAVLKAQSEQPALSTMRTTIVVLLADGGRALWAHLGDSRLYAFENGSIVFQTSDHSVVQRMVDAGEITPAQIRHHEDRNRVLRSLGNAEPEFRPTILSSPRPVSPDAAFLICTDGMWENVLENEMVVDLAKAAGPSEWLAFMEDRLLERATASDDNYSAIAVMMSNKSGSG